MAVLDQFLGVVRMSRAFMPLLHASREARLVNISSLFGLIAPPGQTAYAASKYAVRGFSNSLRHELEGTNIGVTVVHPGGIATAIAKNARIASGINNVDVEAERRKFQAFLKMPPEKAGETIVRAVERRKGRILIGNDAKAASFIERLFPVSYWKIIGGQMKR
nr:SDR family NAD(P)-dependent oxidoreductase [Oleomonas cavernae]